MQPTYAAYRIAGSAFGKIRGLVESDRKLEATLRTELEIVSDDMGMMEAMIKKYSGGCSQVVIDEEWIWSLQSLAYDMEDFVDLLKHKQKESFPKRVWRMVTLTDNREEQAIQISGFVNRMKKLHDSRPMFTSEAPVTLMDGNNGVVITPRALGELGEIGVEPEGMQKAIEDLIRLLSYTEGQPEQLRVVSIVGSRGIGKTTLARMLYGDPGKLLSRSFDCHAWAECNDLDHSGDRLLQEIVHQLDPPKHDGGPVTDVALRTKLSKCLENKRHVIVIDGMRHAGVWTGIKDAFPKDGKSSMIIVTTSVRSVATACSSGSYVYRLQRLPLEDSTRLLGKIIFGITEQGHPDLHRFDELVCRTCDGLPLAVHAVAGFLKSQHQARQLADYHWREMIDHLSKHLAEGKHPAFEPLRRVLVESYEGLLKSSNYDLKMCLLSVSMFPKGYKIKGKSLTRRWIAEGLVTKNEHDRKGSAIIRDAVNALQALIDGSLVELAADCEKACKHKPKVKRCHVQNVLLEFLVGLSVKKKFARLIMNGNLVGRDNDSEVRRLSVQEMTDKVIDFGSDNYRKIRWLSIVAGSGRLLNLAKCKHLRVLDLESCSGVSDEVLRTICMLVLLKYLSLRGTAVRVLPRRMKNLRHLETLDVRETAEMWLPLEVISLPRLAYLFGEFKLPDDLPVVPSLDGTSKKGAIGSQMHTLAGFVIHNHNSTSGSAGSGDNQQAGAGGIGNSIVAEGRSQNHLGQSFRRLASAASAANIPLLSVGSHTTNGGHGTTVPIHRNNSNHHGVLAFQRILTRMSKLKKVKIWWRATTKDNNTEAPSAELTSLLLTSLQTRLDGTDGLESVSLHFGDRSINFLDKLETANSILLGSIKLHGTLNALPGFLTRTGSRPPNLTELNLSSTSLSGEQLSELQYLPYLKYLKLVEENGGSTQFGSGHFHVQTNGFPALMELYVQTPKLPEMRIADGGMKNITTLQLLCCDITGFQIPDISHLKLLEQVVLVKSSLHEITVDAWEQEANKHSNRPAIEYFSS